MRFLLLSAFIIILLLTHGQSSALANVESLWGAKEFHSRTHHLRYLLLLPPNFDPSRKYELWVNLHGSPGCASHAIFQYRNEASLRGAILLAPEATEGAGEFYTLPGTGKLEYHLQDMKQDPDHVLEIIDEVVGDFPVNKNAVALLGFSAGCEMSWRLLAKRPSQFCFLGGVTNRFKNGKTPSYAAGLRQAAKTVPIFYGVGQEDAFAGPDYAVTLKMLRSYGFKVRTVHPPGVGHDLPSSIKSQLIACFDEVRNRLPLDHTPARPPSTVRSRRTSNPFGWILTLSGVAGAALLLRTWQHRKKR